MQLRSCSDWRGFSVHVLPVLLYALALFYLGGIRVTIKLPETFVPQDKINHFGAFGLFVWLAYWAFRFELPAKSVTRLVWLSVLASSFFGMLLECWQLLFPYRSAELLDWVADTLGALVAGYVAHRWITWRGRRVTARN